VRLIDRLAGVALVALAAAAVPQNPEEAEQQLAAQVQSRPSDAAAWKALGLVRASRGHLQAAAEALARACALRAADEEACYYYGRNLFALGRYEDAVQPFEKALRAVPKDRRWRVYRALARNFEWLGRTAEAERNFREAIRLSRGRATPSEDPRVDFGSFLYRQGRTAEALAPLEEAARAQSPSARAHTELGRVLLQLDRVEQAAAALEKAVRLDARDWAAHLLLGRAYLRLERTEAGDREMQIGQQGLQSNQGSSTVR